MTKAANGAVKSWLDDAFLHETDECLISPFKAGSHGYVPVTVQGMPDLSHRYICKRKHGPALGRHAAHSCGNKKCANKRHIRWASRKENEADKLIHGRRTRGEKHGQSKLTETQVLAIRSSSQTQRAIAASFGVSQQLVSEIRAGRRWSWL